MKAKNIPGDEKVEEKQSSCYVEGWRTFSQVWQEAHLCDQSQTRPGAWSLLVVVCWHRMGKSMNTVSLGLIFLSLGTIRAMSLHILTNQPLDTLKTYVFPGQLKNHFPTTWSNPKWIEQMSVLWPSFKILLDQVLRRDAPEADFNLPLTKGQCGLQVGLKDTWLTLSKDCLQPNITQPHCKWLQRGTLLTLRFDKHTSQDT